ncbi:hypothetical protein ACFX2I_012305 [Malus domestica]
MRFTPKNSLPISDFKVINSCNGLPCLSGPGKYGPLYVCMGEYIAFPPANNGRQSGMLVGLGFRAATNEYKVFQTFYPECESSSPDNLYETDISTIGTGVWRSIENAPWDYVCLSFNAFLHGALHWVSESTRCVSKEWLSIISDPQLTHLRASRSPAGILIKSFAPLITSNKVYFIWLRFSA